MATSATQTRASSPAAASSGSTAPAVQTPADIARLTREYVASGAHASGSWLGTSRALGRAIDDVTADFGEDLYEEMLKDPQVSACSTVFKASILEDGVKFDCAVKDDDDPDYELAAQIMDEAVQMLRDLESPLDDTLWNLLDCTSFGNKVGEQNFAFVKGATGAPRLNLTRIKVKPRRSVLFVVDQYVNLVGILGEVPRGWTQRGNTPTVFQPSDGTIEMPNLLDPRKFVIATFRPINEDPRGTSLLRPAYSAWWRKQQVLPEYLKYLAQFAGPSLWATVGANATAVTLEGGLSLTPEELLLESLLAFRNGTALALPNGTEVHALAMQGEGAAFLRALDQCDAQIVKAILTQSLATEEGKFMARAAARVHQDVLDTMIRQAKRSIVGMFRRQILMNWVRLNWGEDVMHLAPIVTLGETEQRDLASLWQGAAALANSNYLHESQLQKMDAQIGLPVREVAQYGQPDGNTPPVAEPPAPPPVAPDRVPVRPHDRGRPQRRQPSQTPQEEEPTDA